MRWLLNYFNPSNGKKQQVDTVESVDSKNVDVDTVLEEANDETKGDGSSEASPDLLDDLEYGGDLVKELIQDVQMDLFAFNQHMNSLDKLNEDKKGQVERSLTCLEGVQIHCTNFLDCMNKIETINHDYSNDVIEINKCWTRIVSKTAEFKTIGESLAISLSDQATQMEKASEHATITRKTQLSRLREECSSLCDAIKQDPVLKKKRYSNLVPVDLQSNSSSIVVGTESGDTDESIGDESPAITRTDSSSENEIEIDSDSYSVNSPIYIN